MSAAFSVKAAQMWVLAILALAIATTAELTCVIPGPSNDLENGQGCGHYCNCKTQESCEKPETAAICGWVQTGRKNKDGYCGYKASGASCTCSSMGITVDCGAGNSFNPVAPCDNIQCSVTDCCINNPVSPPDVGGALSCGATSPPSTAYANGCSAGSACTTTCNVGYLPAPSASAVCTSTTGGDFTFSGCAAIYCGFTAVTGYLGTCSPGATCTITDCAIELGYTATSTVGAVCEKWDGTAFTFSGCTQTTCVATAPPTGYLESLGGVVSCDTDAGWTLSAAFTAAGKTGPTKTCPGSGQSFVFDGCVLGNCLPTNDAAYEPGVCPLGPSCSTDSWRCSDNYTPVGSITASCPNQGQQFVLSGCAPTCYIYFNVDQQTCPYGTTNKADDQACDATGCVASNCCSGTCGDFIMNPGETCDDGNTKSGDGCDENCQLELDGSGQPTQNCNCNEPFTVDYDLDVLVRDTPPTPFYDLFPTNDHQQFVVTVRYPYASGGVYITGSDETTRMMGPLPGVLPVSAVKNSDSLPPTTNPWYEPTPYPTVCTNTNPLYVVGPQWVQTIDRCGYNLTKQIDPLGKIDDILVHRDAPHDAWLTRTIDAPNNMVSIVGTLFTCFLQAVIIPPSMPESIFASSCNRMYFTVETDLTMTKAVGVWGDGGAVRAYIDLTFTSDGHLIVSLTLLTPYTLVTGAQTVDGQIVNANPIFLAPKPQPPEKPNVNFAFTTVLPQAVGSFNPSIVMNSQGDAREFYFFNAVLQIYVIDAVNDPAGANPYKATLLLTGDVVNKNFKTITTYEIQVKEWGSPTGLLADMTPNVPPMGVGDWMIVGVPLPLALDADTGSATLVDSNGNDVAVIVDHNVITVKGAKAKAVLLNDATSLATLTTDPNFLVRWAFEFTPAALLLPAGSYTLRVTIVPKLRGTARHPSTQATLTKAVRALQTADGKLVQLVDGSYQVNIQFTVNSTAPSSFSVSVSGSAGSASAIPSWVIPVAASVGGLAGLLAVAVGAWALLRVRQASSPVCRSRLGSVSSVVAPFCEASGNPLAPFPGLPVAHPGIHQVQGKLVMEDVEKSHV